MNRGTPPGGVQFSLTAAELIDIHSSMQRRRAWADRMGMRHGKGGPPEGGGAPNRAPKMMPIALSPKKTPSASRAGSTSTGMPAVIRSTSPIPLG